MEKRILGNRYELVEKIGGGGMALVYKARCQLLNRYVAVKILRQEFTTDEDFVRRFRIEAQAAASLSHPNIVSIYDVGQEDDIYYIVMEYVDGITLKDYIAQNGPLPWKRALNIGVQICSALDNAHRNRIIHRDIKPHNILITEDGIAKVADFGIARAVSASTLTLAGNTIGSVHYLSPEQARGGYMDEKSDIYSLGIVLYEMLTGKTPFDGDTPIGVALKHIQETPAPPANLKEKIPDGVNNIVLKAIKKEQSKRYQTAAEMLEDIRRVLRNPKADIYIEEEEQNFSTRMIPAINDEVAAGVRDKDMRRNGDSERKKDRLTTWLAVFTAAVIIAVMSYVSYSVATLGGTGEEFLVPDLVGKNIDDMKAEYGAKQLTIKVVNESFSDSVPKNYIISQKPSAGVPIKPPKEIEVEISKGLNVIELPNMENLDWREAEVKIKDSGLLPIIEDCFDDIKPIGIVVKTDPTAGTPLKPGEAVIIYRSKGPDIKQVKVPNVVGRTLEEAGRIISSAGLVVGVVSQQESSQPAGIVLGQSLPPDSSTGAGSAVDITVSSSGNSKIININLRSDYKPAGSMVKVLVKVLHNDTGREEVQYNGHVRVSDFPKAVTITGRGRVHISVYLDDNSKPYAEQDLVFSMGGM